jgi:ATP-dependent helicase/nuclease subunit B
VARPLDRKLVVAPTAGEARELLRRLALEGGGWVGFELTTPRPLALSLARDALDAGGLRLLDPFDQQALLDEALDAVVQSGIGDGLDELTEGVGFREAVHGAVTALRLAGLDAEALRAAGRRDWKRRVFLARVLERYDALLAGRRRADTSTVLSFALAALDRSPDAVTPALGADSIALMPGLGCRGLVGKLLDALRARGATVLETDPVVGLEPPEGILWRAAGTPTGGSFLHAPAEGPREAHTPRIELFRAGSINDELREVLRRAVAAGRRWDEVEIIATDPVAYGSALHALSVRLGVPVTYAVGLPVERTRTGRVVQAYLDWISEGFQAHVIRRLLEAGDLRPRRGARFHAPADLARRFRSLRIGWGRLRYRAQIRQALTALEQTERGKWESAEAFERSTARAREELEALRSILFRPLQETPSVPDRAGEGGGPVSPAELARGLSAFLRRVPRGSGPDAAAREQIERIVERVRATLDRRTNFEAALSILRRHLAIRVRAPEPGEGPDEAGAPWRSEGGHLHLSDPEHGGVSGRPSVFIVGVDAERVPGAGAQDPILPDSDRRLVGHALPTSSDLLRERVFRFAALFARLRGEVTLSYGAWDAVEARSVAPSPVMLQALRLERRDPSVTFEDLHRALGRVACPLPGEGRPALDGDDVWMRALGSGGILRRGTETVRAAFPRLDAGLAARDARREELPGPHHGVIESRPELDPRGHPELVISASRLEDLGTCPLRYLYGNVVRIRPPDDPELDPDRWLDPLRRGGLMHAVYEGTLREARARKIEPKSAAFETLALETLDAQVRAARAEVPSPGDGVARREIGALQEDVRSFVLMIRERGAPWVALEFGFGLGERPAVVLDVPGGAIRLRGAVDRVDEDLSGIFVIDYKTGVPRDHQSGKGAFNGGRRLQHAVYSEAVERLLDRQVVAGQYHFPTRRGENEVHSYERARLHPLPELLARMLDGVAAGAFIPTDESADCRFCDYAPICRVNASGQGGAESPMAEWTKERLVGPGTPPELAYLSSVRTLED